MLHSYKPGIPSTILKYIGKCATIGCFFLLLSCEADRTEDDKDKVYFDLKGFIENQIVYLSEKRPKVSKTTMLDGKSEEVRSSEIDWKKELELFSQADINKPAYRQSYSVSRKDSLHFEYTLKPQMDLPVQYLRISVDSVTSQPIHIQALLKSHNKIYTSEKEIELFCSSKDNVWELSTYRVKGYQKLVLMDKRSFAIFSKIGL
ncbi:hypothetical protein [Dyadobacter sp. CY323]|uniref:hypothetical protein n=1 Tax=Dyadobacter sp. CY323 TaxID=2907302 RepID=UPI001F2CB446|nr:hypothetical protein [Dyadobacter sp. CY323]MCE6988393.1 hypothetical protein [Dyadobacter sp. CY323]